MARFAHLGESSRSCRCMLGGAHALAIAVDRIDRFCPAHNPWRGLCRLRAMVVA